jgi:hypothetical protein
VSSLVIKILPPNMKIKFKALFSKDKKFGQMEYSAGMFELLNELNLSLLEYDSGTNDLCKKVIQNETELMDSKAQYEEDTHVSALKNTTVSPMNERLLSEILATFSQCTILCHLPLFISDPFLMNIFYKALYLKSNYRAMSFLPMDE